jgi:hypothetical protein
MPLGLSSAASGLVPAPTFLCSPLAPAFPPFCLAHCETTLFTIRDKESLLLDVAQDLVTGYFFAKAPEQVLLRFSASKYNSGHIAPFSCELPRQDESGQELLDSDGVSYLGPQTERTCMPR